MKCDICKKHEGTVPVKQVYNGVPKDLLVCQECAAKITAQLQSPASMADFLFGMGVPHETGPAGEDPVCAGCGMRSGDFKKSSRLGCPGCYQAFAEQLTPLLEAMHRGPRHTGKVPAREKTGAEIVALRRALERAVAVQDFEEAAKLRDRIRDLREGSSEALHEGAGDADGTKGGA